MEEEWQSDDTDIPDGENLYRRVPSNPSLVVRDAITGEPTFLKGAFRYDGNDGMSVYREELMQARGIVPADTIPSPETHTVAVFPVGCPRSEGAGVVDCPGDHLSWMKTERPDCHATVRLPTAGLDKKHWGRVRDCLLAHAREVSQSAPTAGSWPNAT